MRVAISSGHSTHVIGAVGVIDEVTENRRVVDRLGQLINAINGNSAVIYHDTASRTARDNVNGTFGWHNRQQRDMDIHVHFNAFSPTAGPRGTEMLYRADAQRALAARMSAAVATAGGFINRGAKHRTNLGFLNHAARPAILPEICFVDSQADVTLYQRNFEAICRALAESIIGRVAGAAPPDAAQPSPAPTRPLDDAASRPLLRRGSTGTAVRELQHLLVDVAVDGSFGPMTEEAVRDFQRMNSLDADGIVGQLTWTALLK